MYRFVHFDVNFSFKLSRILKRSMRKTIFVEWFHTLNEIRSLQSDTQKRMPPAITLNTVERSDDLSNERFRLSVLRHDILGTLGTEILLSRATVHYVFFRQTNTTFYVLVSLSCLIIRLCCFFDLKSGITSGGKL
jgi:hypothetical protein